MQNLRTYLMPLAIVAGILLPQFHGLSFSMPWLIATLMFLSFVGGATAHEKGSTRWVAVRVLAGSLFYALLTLFAGWLLDWSLPVILAGLLLCLAPPANASPAMTRLLGGNAVLMLNLVVGGHALACFVIPGFAAVSQGIGWNSSFAIGNKVFWSVMPLVVLPIGSALLLRRLLPTVASRVAQLSAYTMLLWSFMVFVVISSASFNIRHLLADGSFTIHGLLGVAVLSLVLALALFYTGWRLGRGHYPIETSQGLGQKNTVLMIWVAQAYVHPVAALGPVFYVVWQNLILSYLTRRLGR